MHPVLLTIASINAGVCMKATSHSYSLATYLPIPKFKGVPSEEQSLLSNHIYHICLDIITHSLKEAKDVGKDLSDPAGNVCQCHTPLVSWIADLPEQHVPVGVTSSQSPTSTTTLNKFGDGICHLHHICNFTPSNIAMACSTADPKDLPPFIKASSLLSLNGVHQPFWCNWEEADPLQFLTTDALHQWHKFYSDHPLKWMINIMRRA